MIKRLNYYYYGVMCLTLLVMGEFAILYSRGMLYQIDAMSTLGMAIQYIVILDALACIPGGLYSFKRRVAPLRSENPTDEQLARYERLAANRIMLVSHPMVLGVAAYYLLGGYQSMLWIAAIAAVSWYFTKPTENKARIELRPENPNEEKY